MRSTLLLVPLALSALAAPLAAQQWQVTPFAGVTIPNKTLLNDTAATSYYASTTHTIFGMTIGREISPAFGVELAAGFGHGGFEAVGSGATTVISLQSSMWFADLRGRVRLIGSDDASLGLIGGVGYTRYRNALFDTAHLSTPSIHWDGTFTGIGGLGAQGRISNRVRVSVEAVDRIHGQGIKAGTLSGIDTHTQHDLTFTAGLGFSLGK